MGTKLKPPPYVCTQSALWSVCLTLATSSVFLSLLLVHREAEVALLHMLLAS